MPTSSPSRGNANSAPKRMKCKSTYKMGAARSQGLMEGKKRAKIKLEGAQKYFKLVQE